MATAEQLFEEHKKLVYYVYNKYFDSFPENKPWKEDILQEGMLALWRACLTFEEDRGFEFATFAVKVIRNKMLEYINRKLSKHYNTKSLDEIIYKDKEDRPITIQDRLDDDNQIEKYTDKIIIRECIKDSPERIRFIVTKVMQGYSQKTIAKILGVSQTHVSRLFDKFKTKLKIQMEEDKHE